MHPRLPRKYIHRARRWPDAPLPLQAPDRLSRTCLQRSRPASRRLRPAPPPVPSTPAYPAPDSPCDSRSFRSLSTRAPPHTHTRTPLPRSTPPPQESAASPQLLLPPRSRPAPQTPPSRSRSFRSQSKRHRSSHRPRQTRRTPILPKASSLPSRAQPPLPRPDPLQGAPPASHPRALSPCRRPPPTKPPAADRRGTRSRFHAPHAPRPPSPSPSPHARSRAVPAPRGDTRTSARPLPPARADPLPTDPPATSKTRP